MHLPLGKFAVKYCWWIFRRLLFRGNTYIAQNTCGYDLMRYTIRLNKIKCKNKL